MSLNAEPSLAGQTVNCPSCGQRLQIPAATPSAVGSGLGLGAEGKRGGWPETDPSNVNAWLALGYGMGAMLVTVGLLYLVRNSFIGQVFFSGGWVNYAEFVLFFWGLGILFLKSRKTRHQHDALLLDVLPQKIGKEINAANVDMFIDQVYRLPERLRDSMMVNRIRKGLELFEVRTNNTEVTAMLNAQSTVDANRIASSYALLKVFLWAIPILGFIGTVLGLSVAMASFGTTDLNDMEALKGAVAAITSGLATAFNTTLLGLILSMVLIFPMSTMQAREDDCLTDIDAFCNEQMLPRLNDGSANTAAASRLLENPAAFTQMLTDFVAGQMRLAEDIGNVTATVQHAAENLEARAQHHQQVVHEQLNVSISQLMQQTGDSVTSSAKMVEKYMGSLSSGIESLNRALNALGEKQIVLNVPPKRGWSLFGGGKSADGEKK
ncbi:MAG: MotA/TolQ/ExbB proton channel family protein [Chthoniobacteraceae bacterium]